MTDSTPSPADQIAEVAGAVEELAAVLTRSTNKETILQALAEQVVSVVPGADMASITVITSSEPYTGASTDPRAWQIDDAQYTEGDGPCLRAARTGELVRVEMSTAAELWPTFARVSGEFEVGSFLAAPLTVDKIGAGAINLFSFGAHGFHEVDEQFLRLYTVIAQTAMRSVGRAQLEEEIEQLRSAIASRAVIEQAKGILMAVRGLTDDQAFQELVTQSQRDNVKLRILARRFVAMATGRAAGPDQEGAEPSTR